MIILGSSTLPSAHPTNSRTLRIRYGTSGKIEARATIKKNNPAEKIMPHTEICSDAGVKTQIAHSQPKAVAYS